MEKKKLNPAVLGIGAVALVAVLAAVWFFVLRKDGYRNIQVFDLEGKNQITRSTGAMDPYKNMLLQSGDGAETFNASWMQLKLDDDKYIQMEADTQMELEALGTKQDSLTTIHLNKGAITNFIHDPLSAASDYAVYTPNSTMAVRGTTFRVYVWYDENGVSHTVVQCFAGRVEVHLLFPDGTTDEEGVMLEAGMEVGIWGNDITSAYEFGPRPIDWDDLSLRPLYFIDFAIDNEEPIVLPQKDVQTIIDLKEHTYGVRYLYNGNLFASQDVVGDEFLTPPKLAPAPGGSWDYDFSQRLKGEVDINWIG